MTEIAVKHAKIREFRVTYDGGSAYFAREETANSKAESIAKSGVPCEMETRAQAGQLWKLKFTYTPQRGGRFTKTDPYTSGTGVAFEDESFQGRIAT